MGTVMTTSSCPVRIIPGASPSAVSELRSIRYGLGLRVIQHGNLMVVFCDIDKRKKEKSNA